MKTFLLILITSGILSAQTKVDKTIPVKAGQKVKMRFDYPDLIKVSTWDKNEISIKGDVSINGGESDDAFILDTRSEGNAVIIRNEIKDMDKIPHRITVHVDGQKLVFRNKTEWKKYEDEHGKNYSMMNNGVEMDITLEIKVPRNMETLVECVYGTVEIRDFTGPLTVEATYGGVDASITEQSTGELVAETNYGHIYSNLNLLVNSKDIKDENFHTYVSAKPGSGPRYSFESKYGNVYLRKGN
ncbi:MAG: hypothetical protein WDN75_04305 [Bacteroidota bacterium]